MDLEYVKKLITLLEKSKLSKLVIREKNGVEIALEKEHKSSPPPPPHKKGYSESKQPEHPKMEGSFPAERKEEKKIEEFTDTECIKSPMIGTFYRAESPEKKPFKSEGDTVSVGDTLCIIEAMKVMNEIKSDRAGTVHSILVQDMAPVEYGQQLFVIK